MRSFFIEGREVGGDAPAYFIADIAANHDGDLERAKELIALAKKSGADAAKFQHFRAEHIVSREGFERLGRQVSHQSKWKKSVFEVYQDASVPFEWTRVLKEECDRVGIHFFTSAYDLEMVDLVDPFVPAYKIGSGDVNWLQILERIASKGKPVILATGAATMVQVERAVTTVTALNPDCLVMQCNTNYTADDETNLPHINLRVLDTYREAFPDIPLGLSDHTQSLPVVLGAISKGGKAVERHFTDDRGRDGPDHKFAMDPEGFREMVDAVRELEVALGDGVKRVQPNERETVVLQQRCIRAAEDLASETTVVEAMLGYQRPAPADGFEPWEADRVVGRTLSKGIARGEHFTEAHFT